MKKYLINYDKFEEHDIVECIDSSLGVPVGTRGTIIFINCDTLFEIEFLIGGKYILLSTKLKQVKKIII